MDNYQINQSLEKVSSQMKLLINEEYIESLKFDIAWIEQQMIDPDFYSDQNKVNTLSAQLRANKDIISKYNSINTLIDDINAYLDMLSDEYDLDIEKEIEIDIAKLIKEYDEFEIIMLLDEEYDKNDALVEIHVGAGGTESQDWAEMLYKMYLAYAKKKNFKVEIINAHYATDVGIKNITMKIKGYYAYGLLKNEKGVHRLIRISPFDAGDRRHTTFAMVNIAPILEDVKEIEIKDSDLEIDTFKSSGAGGQSVNTTDSAVRITHKPTGIVVTSQNQRSQLQNKAEALEVLKAKLLEMQIEQKKKEMQELKGDNVDVNFGSQIRTYVFHPYSMVKDHRSNFEASNPNDVLNGELDDIINSILRVSKGR